MSFARLLATVLIAVMAAALAGCGATAAPSASAADHASHAAPTQSVAPGPTEGAADEEPPADAARLEDGATIVMSQFAFDPTSVVVPVGATLTFVNEDNIGHTVTEGVQGFAVDGARFDQPVMAGDSIQITFDEAGRYDITCEPHPIMQMTVFAEG